MRGAAARAEVAGLQLDICDEGDAVRIIVDAFEGGVGGRVVTPNLDILQQVTHSPWLRELVDGADLSLADGMPLVWASRVAGRRLPGRVAGANLGPRLAYEAMRRGWSVLLVGGSPGVAERAATVLRASVPTGRVGAYFPPYGFDLSEKETKAIFQEVSRWDPCICLVGLGFPRQDALARDLHEQFQSSVFLGVGGAIGLLAGETRRAPSWAQTMGVEWTWRLAQEPRRLAGRYIVRGLPCAAALFGWAARERLRLVGSLIAQHVATRSHKLTSTAAGCRRRTHCEAEFGSNRDEGPQIGP